MKEETQLTLNWYQQLVADCQQFIQEAKEQIVYKHWQMGKRILEDELKFEKPEYGSQSIANLADDLNLSKTTIYYQLQFAKRYPEFSNALENLPWRQAVKLLALPKKQNQIDSSVLSEEFNEGYQIYTGDYSQLYGEIPDNNADLFFTDPPYDKESLYLFAELSQLAQYKLKPGGLCLTYAPHPHLPTVIEKMSMYLDYWWAFSVYQTGGEARIWNNHLWVRWKPILVFSKRPMDGRLTDTWFNDAIRGEGKDKRYHKWGQNVQEATYWIESLTPGKWKGLVVDPFCGGGTIPIACKLTKRKWIATEIDPNIAAIARKRIEDCKCPM